MDKQPSVPDLIYAFCGVLKTLVDDLSAILSQSPTAPAPDRGSTAEPSAELVDNPAAESSPEPEAAITEPTPKPDFWSSPLGEGHYQASYRNRKPITYGDVRTLIEEWTDATSKDGSNLDCIRVSYIWSYVRTHCEMRGQRIPSLVCMRYVLHRLTVPIFLKSNTYYCNLERLVF